MKLEKLNDGLFENFKDDQIKDLFRIVGGITANTRNPGSTKNTDTIEYTNTRKADGTDKADYDLSTYKENKLIIGGGDRPLVDIEVNLALSIAGEI